VHGLLHGSVAGPALGPVVVGPVVVGQVVVGRVVVGPDRGIPGQDTLKPSVGARRRPSVAAYGPDPGSPDPACNAVPRAGWGRACPASC